MNIAVVGLGYWGSKVFEEYVSLRNQGIIDNVFACDINQQRLKNVAEADETYESVTAAIEDVDGLHVCTGNQSHYDIAEQALLNATDILVEKPLTVDRDRAYDLVEMASANGRILQTGHVFRFANVVRELNSLYEEDYFGGVNAITLRWTHNIEPFSGTNVLWDLLPHPIDILNFVTGGWLSDIEAMGTRSTNTDTYEQATVCGTVDNTQVLIQVSWADHVRRRNFEIAGKKRSAVANCVDQTLNIHEKEQPIDKKSITKNNTIESEANNFVSAIHSGENKFNSAIVGARTVDIIEQTEAIINDK